MRLRERSQTARSRCAGVREEMPLTTAADARADTFPKLLARNARTRPNRTAFRHKDLGIWQSWTWGEVHEIVRAYASGLQAIGLEARRQDRHRRLQPSLSLLDHRRRPMDRRDPDPGLCGLGRGGDGLCAGPCRSDASRRCRTRSRSTRSSPSPSSCPSSSMCSTTSRRACGTTTTAACTPSSPSSRKGAHVSQSRRRLKTSSAPCRTARARISPSSSTPPARPAARRA